MADDVLAIELADMRIIAFEDAAPPPVAWSYAFPHDSASPDDAVCGRWAPDGLFQTQFTVFALVREGRVAVVDLGLGPGPSAYFGGLRGKLDGALAAAGITPDDVERVLFTHFHLDHVGWASRDGEPFFRHAVCLAPQAELDHWRLAGAQAALPHHVTAFDEQIAPLLSAGQLHGLAPGTTVEGWPGVSFLAAPGHTAGHAAVLVATQGQALMIAGDTWHSPAQIERPRWCHRADRDREAAIAARQYLAAIAAEQGMLVAAGHFPEAACFGRIRKDNDAGHRFEPLARTMPACGTAIHDATSSS